MTTEATVSGREAVLDELRARDEAASWSTHENPDGDALGSLVAMQEHLDRARQGQRHVHRPASEFPLPHEYRLPAADGSRVRASRRPRASGRSSSSTAATSSATRRRRTLQRSGARILNIDHHHDNTRFGTVNHVDPEASCTAEIVWDLMHALGCRADPTIAEALYVGLDHRHGPLHVREHRAARARDGGRADRGRRRRPRDLPARSTRACRTASLALLARGLSNVERYDDGRLTHHVAERRGLHRERAPRRATPRGHRPSPRRRGHAWSRRSCATVSTTVCPARTSGARVRKVSLRAGDTRIDVSAIARAQGGGGHRLAAGFSDRAVLGRAGRVPARASSPRSCARC